MFTKCWEKKKNKPKNPGAEPATPFPSVSARPRESRELSLLPRELNCHLFSSKQLSQNYTHAGLNIWEEICGGSYLNTKVRLPFLYRTRVIDVLPLSTTSAKLRAFQIICLMASNNLLHQNNTSPSGSKPKFLFWINFSKPSSLSLTTGKFQNWPVFGDIRALFHSPSFGNSHWFSRWPSALVTLNHRSNQSCYESYVNQTLKFLTPVVFRLDCHSLGCQKDLRFYSMSWFLSMYCSQIHFQDWVFFQRRDLLSPWEWACSTVTQRE